MHAEYNIRILQAAYARLWNSSFESVAHSDSRLLSISIKDTPSFVRIYLRARKFETKSALLLLLLFAILHSSAWPLNRATLDSVVAPGRHETQFADTRDSRSDNPACTYVPPESISIAWRTDTNEYLCYLHEILLFNYGMFEIFIFS